MKSNTKCYAHTHHTYKQTHTPARTPTHTHTHTPCICKYIPCRRALQRSHLMKNNSQSKHICKLHIQGADNYNAGLHSRFALLLRHTKMPTKTPPVAMAATSRTTITPAAIAPPSAVLLFPFPVFPFPVFPFPVFPLPSPGLPLPLVQLHPLTTSDRTMRLRLSHMHTHSQHAASTPTFDGDKRYCTVHCVCPCIEGNLFHNTILSHLQVVVNVI